MKKTVWQKLVVSEAKEFIAAMDEYRAARNYLNAAGNNRQVSPMDWDRFIRATRRIETRGEALSVAVHDEPSR